VTLNLLKPLAVLQFVDLPLLFRVITQTQTAHVKRIFSILPYGVTGLKIAADI
jgi:hypothetical protein